MRPSPRGVWNLAYGEGAARGTVGSARVPAPAATYTTAPASPVIRESVGIVWDLTSTPTAADLGHDLYDTFEEHLAQSYWR